MRCCADKAIRIERGSTASSCQACEDAALVDRFYYPSNSTSNVCVTTAVSDGGSPCSFEANFENAVKGCAALGARLCNIEELSAKIYLADPSCSTVDSQRLWSRSAGDDCADDHVLTLDRGTPACESISVTNRLNYVCCADSVSANRKSDMSCVEHRVAVQNFANTAAQNGWTAATNGVCAASQLTFDVDGAVIPAVDNGRCQTNMTWNQAERTCAINGARLCSQHELVTRGMGSGCGFDLQIVFTNEPCNVTDGTPGVLMARTTRVNVTETRCVDPDMLQTDGALRCCADVDVPAKEFSAQTCSDLGFIKTETGTANVCGSSFVNGSCNPNAVSSCNLWRFHFGVANLVYSGAL